MTAKEQIATPSSNPCHSTRFVTLAVAVSCAIVPAAAQDLLFGRHVIGDQNNRFVDDTPRAFDFDGDGRGETILAGEVYFDLFGDVMFRERFEMTGDNAIVPAFSATDLFGLGTSPWSIGSIAADVDGDGFLDLVYSEHVYTPPGSVSYANTVGWMRNTGAAPATFVVGGILADFNNNFPGMDVDAAVDFDDDGDADLLYANGTGLYWIENDGFVSDTGDLIQLLPGSHSGARFADLNNDQLIDVIKQDGTWLRNLGGPTPLFAIEPWGSADSTVYVCELDGLAGDDLLEFNPLTRELTAHLNSVATPGTFTSVVVATVAPGTDVLGTPDFTADGRADVMLSIGDGWMENDLSTSGTFLALTGGPALVTIGTPANGPKLAFSFADIDGDGDDDVLTSDDAEYVWFETSEAIILLTQERFRSLNEALASPLGGETIRFGKAFIENGENIQVANDHFGHLEVTSGFVQPEDHQFFLNERTLIAPQDATIEFNGTITDFSTISAQNIIVNGPADGSIGEYGTLVADSIEVQDPGYLTTNPAAGLVIDNRVDPFWIGAALEFSSQVRIEVVNDFVVSVPPEFVQAPTPWQQDGNSLVHLDAADLDDDGDPDLLAIIEDALLVRSLVWYELTDTAGPVYTAHTLTSPAGSPLQVLAVDLTEDGRADLVVRCDAGGVATTSWAPNTGSSPGQFDVATFTQIASGPLEGGLAAARYGQGHPVSVLSGNDLITLQWNPGFSYPGMSCGFGTTDLTISTCESENSGSIAVSESPVVADFTGDGFADIFHAGDYGFDTDRIRFWYSDGPCPGDLSPSCGLSGRPFVDLNANASWFAVDVDGDGDAELIHDRGTVATRRQRIEVFDITSDPTGMYGLPGTVVARLDDRQLLAAGAGADINRDGHQDLVIADGSRLWWYDNQLADGRTFTRFLVADDTTTLIVNADVDADGYDDIITQNGIYLNGFPGELLLAQQPYLESGGNGRIRASRLVLDEDVLIDVSGGLDIDPSGELWASTFCTIVGSVKSAGTLRGQYGTLWWPSLSYGLTINGDYEQKRQIDGTEHTGVYEVNFKDLPPFGAPLAPGFVPLLVTGQATLTGGLRVTVESTFDPAIGERFEILRADGGIVGVFDVAVLDPLPGGKFFSVEYDDTTGAESVWLVVEVLIGNIGFNPEDPQALNGSPTAAVLGDVTGDNLLDIIVTIAGANAATDPGKLVVLKNASFSGGLWTGYEAAIEYNNAQIGVLPSWVDVGDLDGDGDLDIAVSNFGTPGNTSADTVTVIVNEIVGGDFTVDLAETFVVGDAPSGLRIDHFDDDGLLDIVVANNGSGDVTVMYGLSAVLPDWPEFDFPPPTQLPAEEEPWGVGPGILNPLIGTPGGGGISPNDLVLSSIDGDSVVVLFNEGGRVFSTPQSFGVGQEPVQVLIKDLNGDDLPELITVNREGSSISVLRNVSDALSTAFAPSVELPLGDVPKHPSSFATGDFDADLDADLAIVADGENGNRVITVLRNDTTLVGGTVLFTELPDVSSSNNLWIVLAGDVTNDGADDIVTISSPGGTLSRSPAGNDVVPLVGQGGCRADMTTQSAGQGTPGYGVPDGIITGADIQFYVNLWINLAPGADMTTQGAGQSDPGYGQPDGLVTGGDIQFYINMWIAGCP